MAVRIFRPHEPALGASPPVGTWGWSTWTDAGRCLLNWAAARFPRHRLRAAFCVVLLVAGTVAQVMLCLMVAELVHLTLSLMEVWVELAAKHQRLLL